MSYSLAEYIWIDGTLPTRQLRSKTRIFSYMDEPNLEDFPQWSFDGSSTEQATGDNSDCLLQPVCFVDDPLRGEGNYLVMCEVLNPDETPHESNSRAELRAVLEAGANDHEPWIGFEQEYTLFKHRQPLGWPNDGFPGPQGPYYCGVGANKVFGRDIAEEHMAACIAAGIMIYGINAEVMPGQWEFQIGYRGIEGESCDVLTVSDHTWIARWLLKRISEEYEIHASLDNKPVKGDWNGAGMHTNFSTNATRQDGGIKAIHDAMKLLEAKHEAHIPLYGENLADRLTGLHETCSIEEFKHGVADRGCSIRIPQPVNISGKGYFEDRRPGANADPYLVAAILCTTLCGVDESVLKFRSWPRKKVTLKKAA